MYKTIVLDCQGINSEISCGDCIAYRSCEMSRHKHVEADKALLVG